jgi:LPXTG-site transpeptidase (sortase) family protein
MANKRTKVIRYVGIALIVIGAVVLAYPFYTNFVMKQQESEILDMWESQVTTATDAQETALTVTGETVATEMAQTGQETSAASDTSEEAVVAETLSPDLFILDPSKKVPFKIIIPKIGVEWIVHEGTSVASLKKGPGHYPGTVLPGEVGLCVIAGHRTTYGAPFNRVDKLVAGDQIMLETANNESFIYYVTVQTEVKPDDISLLNQPFSYPSLALTTCTPKFYATRRLIVFADMK